MLTWLVLIVAFSAGTQLRALEARGADSPAVTMVVITQADVDALGGWPLNRKWYAIAIQNLSDSDAERILIDIAFPHADAAHPESDQLFFQTLANHQNVLLLADEPGLAQDSISLMGRWRLPSERFFAPFSSSFDVRGKHLEWRDRVPGAFAPLLAPGSFPADRLLIRIPADLVHPSYSLLEVIQGNIGPIRGDVVIALDHPGVTSYVAHASSKKPLPTAALQVYAASQLRGGHFQRELNAGLVLLLLFGALLPLAAAGRRLERKRWIWLSGALCLVVPLGLMVGGIYVPPVSFGILTLPALLLGYVEVRRRRRTVSAPHDPLPPDPADRQELDDLRWRMRFYEHLESQPTSEEIVDADGGIHFAPGSPLIHVLRKARKVAQTDISVLILGESGVGKELVARYLHDHSKRTNAPFLAINCAAVPSELIESELFGHEKGAFTGAHGRKSGLFERADGGTLFLDEVSETSTAFQAKLLRVLQDGTFARVGGSQRLRSSVRVIAATHRDLQEAIGNSRFREDLYYRLNGITLSIPPLRERPGDIGHLFRCFLAESGRELKASDALFQWLGEQHWPGNVRELRAATQRAVVNADLQGRRYLLPQDFELKTSVSPPKSAQTIADQVLEELRRQQFHARSISRTAEALSLHRSTVTEYLRGWIIRCTAAHGREAVVACLKGSAEADDEQLQKRVQRYLRGIEAKIEEGVRQGETDSEILLGRFRNMPHDFHEDLERLISALRNRE